MKKSNKGAWILLGLGVATLVAWKTGNLKKASDYVKGLFTKSTTTTTVKK